MDDPLHALVCNAFGYDKSIVRALALKARQIGKDSGDDGLAALAQRVIDAEGVARMGSLCAVVHPLPTVDHAFIPWSQDDTIVCRYSTRVESERTYCRQPRSAHPG